MERLKAKLIKRFELLQISFEKNALGKRQAFSWTKLMNRGKETNCCKCVYKLISFFFSISFFTPVQKQCFKLEPEIQDEPTGRDKTATKIQEAETDGRKKQRQMDGRVAVYTDVQL